MGRQRVQRQNAGLQIQGSVPGKLYGQGTGGREDRRGVQTAQLRYQKGSESDAQEERQEGRRLRPQRRLPELHQRERRGAHRRVR